MPYHIERLQNPDALLVRFTDPFEPRQHASAFFDDLNTHFANEADPIITILDVRDMTVTVQRLLAGMKMVEESDNSPLDHPMSAYYIFVSESKIIQAASDVFFRFRLVHDTKVVSSIEAAQELIAMQTIS